MSPTHGLTARPPVSHTCSAVCWAPGNLSSITGFPGSLPAWLPRSQGSTLAIPLPFSELPYSLQLGGMRAPGSRKSEVGSFAFLIFVFRGRFVFRKWALLSCGQLFLAMSFALL
jgi:hypothetical protein